MLPHLGRPACLPSSDRIGRWNRHDPWIWHEVGLQQGLWRAAYWLEEHGKDRVQDASALLKEALDLLRQYKVAPALQAEVQAAYEVSCM